MASSKEACSIFVNMNDKAALAEFEAMDAHMEPVNGVVQPLVHPPEGKPHRNTNLLQYVLKTVLKAILKHNYAWIFEKPVDSVRLRLPNYHTIIKYPMDLTTIKKRIENFYYYDVKECIKDFQCMFYNVYQYNKPGEDVLLMAQTIEKLFVAKMEEGPKEVESSIPSTSTSVTEELEISLCGDQVQHYIPSTSTFDDDSQGILLPNNDEYETQPPPVISNNRSLQQFNSEVLSTTQADVHDLETSVSSAEPKSTRKSRKRALECDVLLQRANETMEFAKTLCVEEDRHDLLGKYLASHMRLITDENLYLETKIALEGIINDACRRMISRK